MPGVVGRRRGGAPPEGLPGRHRAGGRRRPWGVGSTGKWLVIGLGNPGPEYQRTRHNAGFAVLGVLAARHGLRFRRPWLAARGETAVLRWRGQEITLLRPLTYMNLSGEAVRPFLRGDGFSPSELLLVYDDMDLPLGRLRVRPAGSSGGHRGVASVLAAVGSEAVPRVRVGIGRPADGVDAAEYVLSAVPPQEQAVWAAALERAADAVETVCAEGLEAAMARFNRVGQPQGEAGAP
jgi:PTH1 family peptidyl-tRNA hydrolase